MHILIYAIIEDFCKWARQNTLGQIRIAIHFKYKAISRLWAAKEYGNQSRGKYFPQKLKLFRNGPRKFLNFSEYF